jgi:hypothetical protein
MPVYVDTLPQNIETIKTTKITDLVKILPEQIDYKINVWIGGKLARYGITTDNLIFFGEVNNEPSVELKLYFSSLVKSLGVQATISKNWKVSSFDMIRLYNEGNLIIDKKTMKYIEPITEVHELPIIEVKEIIEKLPKEIEWKCTIYLTGGLVKNGWSANDIDIMTFDLINDRKIFIEMKNYFTDLFGWKTDVGSTIMEEREPIYLYKIYEKGELCL